MKTGIVASKDLSSKNLTARFHLLGPEKRVRVSIEAEGHVTFFGEPGGEDYRRALSVLDMKLRRHGIHMGRVEPVVEAEETDEAV